MKVLIGVAILVVGLAGWCQADPSTRYRIEPSQVATALSNETTHVDAEQIQMLAQVTSTDANPQLEILSVAPTKESAGALVMLGCGKRSSCLPFYVLVENNDAASGLLASEKHASSMRSAKKTSIMMRAGTHATLRMDSPRAQISLAVVSLENGGVGSRVRVATPDHKQFFVGEVVGPNLLKGSF